MHIGLILRSNSSLWGGDMQLLLRLKDALVHMGHHVIIGTTGYDVLLADVVLLTNLMIYQKDIMEMLLHNKIPYFVLCFHEDITQYYLPSNGLPNYVKKCIEGVPDYSIDRLYENPHAVYYEEVAKLQFCAKSALFAQDPPSAQIASSHASSETISYFSDFFPRGYYFIFDLLKSAQCCIANSKMEERTIRRDCPFVQTAVIPLPHAEWLGDKEDPLKGFFDALGLQGKPYLLQVGRLETRKNQLATLLATRNMDIPLVLIAVESHQGWYEKLCIETAVRFRKAPTLIISQNLPAYENGPVKVIPMPDGKIMPKAFMQTVFDNARLYIHPAFCELPGFVFFEAIKNGVPIVASEWCTIQDYLVHSGPENIQYVLPFHIAALESKVEQFLSVEPKKVHVPEPCLKRSTLDYAQEIIDLIEQKRA
jgi:glycosyltransferase involved in cell wall biosynthesis